MGKHAFFELFDFIFFSSIFPRIVTRANYNNLTFFSFKDTLTFYNHRFLKIIKNTISDTLRSLSAIQSPNEFKHRFFDKGAKFNSKMFVIAKVGSQQQSSTLKSISSKMWIHHFNQILISKRKLKYQNWNILNRMTDWKIR